MRKVNYLFPTLFTIFIFFSLISVAQIHPYIPPIIHNSLGYYSDYPCGTVATPLNPAQGPSVTGPAYSNPTAMLTNYDMQCSYSLGKQRLCYWPSDNTMAACATWSIDSLYSFPGKGTGYNYFDGSHWGSMPATRVESVRTARPSLQPYGINGECLLSHQGYVDPLVFSTRLTKGTGAWTESFVPNPPGDSGMVWPKMVTSGADHLSVHILAIPTPYMYGGVPFNGMNEALLYIRSTDGGATWENWQQLPGMTVSEYLGFDEDTYAWADPRGDTLCFMVSSCLMDAFIMKSTDNGTTWIKTIIYNSPYNLTGTSVSSPDWFYCPDGSCDIAMDKSGMAHVTFAMECDSISSDIHLYHQRWTNGIVYWNESMPVFGQELNPETLFANHQLIGWVTDTMVFHQPDYILPGGYYGAIAGTPSMVIDDDNNLFVAWMNPTSVHDSFYYMLSHIYERTATIYPGYGVYWHDSINDLTGDPEYTFKECVFPSFSPKSGSDRFFLLFQCDDLAGSYGVGASTGSACYDGQEIMSENDMIVMSILKSDVGVGIPPAKPASPAFLVLDNFPNPCHGNTTILATINESGNLSLEVTNIFGQKVYFEDKGFSPAGSYQFMIDAGSYKPGIYFYTVRLNSRTITKKMMVD